MHPFKTGWLLPAILSFTTITFASPLSLKQAEQMALQNNPGLQAHGQQAQAMRAIPAQVGSLPDPILSLNALNLPVDSFSTSQENMTQMQVGLSQPLPFPGKLGLRKQAAEQLAAAADDAAAVEEVLDGLLPSARQLREWVHPSSPRLGRPAADRAGCGASASLAPVGRHVGAAAGHHRHEPRRLRDGLPARAERPLAGPAALAVLRRDGRLRDVRR